MASNEINKVNVLIRRFLFEVDPVLNDAEACRAWLNSFAKTLQFQDLCDKPNKYAVALLDEARDFCAAQQRNARIKQVRRILAEQGIKDPTGEQIERELIKRFGDASTREGEDAETLPGNGIATERTTVSSNSTCNTATESPRSGSNRGKNLTGADAVDGDTTDDKSGTSAPEIMPRVGQNEARPRIQGGDRPVQGPMSRSPEAAAQSGKDYDQDADNTDEKHNEMGADSSTREGEEANPSGESRASWASGQSAPPQSPCNTADTAPQRGAKRGKNYGLQADGGSLYDAYLEQVAAMQDGPAPAPARKARTAQARKGTDQFPRDKQEVLMWALDNDIDMADADECFEATKERGFLDGDGKRISNWRGFVAQWCATRDENRKNRRSA